MHYTLPCTCRLPLPALLSPPQLHGPVTLGVITVCITRVTARVIALIYDLDKKAICMGLVFSAGNSGGIVSSQAYRNKDAPRFQPGHATAMAFCLLNGSMALLLYIMNKRENRRRDEKYGPAPLPDEVQEYDDPAYQQKWGLEGMTRAEVVELGDDHPAFRYWL